MLGLSLSPAEVDSSTGVQNVKPQTPRCVRKTVGDRGAQDLAVQMACATHATARLGC